jgi:hypothetical protein
VDGQPRDSLDEAPYTVAWTPVDVGDYILSATATDDDSITVSSSRVPVFVTDAEAFDRFEAEHASYGGDVQTKISLGASGRRYAAMEMDGAIAFEDIEASDAGLFLLTFRYRLRDEGDVAYLSVSVNDEPVQDLRFNGKEGSWHQRGLEAQLVRGNNTLLVSNDAVGIDVDFLSVSVAPVNVAAESDDAGQEVPFDFGLSQNYPNPFEERTRIQYSIPEATHVNVEVLDLTGKHVVTLVDEIRHPGFHLVTLEANLLASGIYLYRMTAGTFDKTRRFVILR